MGAVSGSQARRYRVWVGLVAGLSGLLTASAPGWGAPTNNWQAIAGAGKWEAPFNWSQGLPSLAHGVHYIPAGSVPSDALIDGATVLSNFVNGCLSVSNVTLRGGVGALGQFATLRLDNANVVPGNSALLVLNRLSIQTRGSVIITNSRLRVGLAGVFNDGIFNDGSLQLLGGELTTSNGVVHVGDTGVGNMTVRDGTWQADTVIVGNAAGARGTLTISGGTNSFEVLYAGSQEHATGTVWVTGGQHTGQIWLGPRGSGQMTISNGTWTAPLFRPTWVGQFGSSSATLTVAGGWALLRELRIGSAPFGQNTGTVWVTGGRLDFFDGAEPSSIGQSAAGMLVVSNGVCLAGDLVIGEFGGGNGMVVIAGGSNVVTSGRDCVLGKGHSSTGTLWMTGGKFIVNGLLHLGGLSGAATGGVGRAAISGGEWRSTQVYVGGANQGQGELTIEGGQHHYRQVWIGAGSNSTGQFSMTGGEFRGLETNSFLHILRGQMTVAGGLWLAQNVFVQQGLTMAGGAGHVFSNLVVGATNCVTTGQVTVTSGSLFVTNAAGNAVLEVRGGQIAQTGGHVEVDVLVITNACGRFQHTGGTLVTGEMVLHPNFDADSDGVTNGDELVAGSDPLDPHSLPFRITNITREGNHVRLTWLTAGGKTNVVQHTTGDSGGGFTNHFADLSGPIVPPGLGPASTNYLHLNGGLFTNSYYRIRLLAP